MPLRVQGQAIPPAGDATGMRVFVHLACGFDSVEWERRWTAGRMGMNDRLPYGYFRAESDKVRISYSTNFPERAPKRYVRLFARLILGFDLVHAWRNQAGIMAADVVWTHTESQHLAIGLIFLFRKITGRHRRPKMIGQSVWLFDSWKRFTAPRRWFYKLLLRQSDVLTVLSPDNLQILRRILPEIRSELVLFGVKADPEDIKAPMPRVTPNPVRVLSMGNDRDRDWPVLVAALGNDPGIEVAIASLFARAAVRGCRNITVCRPETKAEILALYEWADIVVVPLKPNLHASGITVMQESATLGIPVICTDTGGLRAYFDGQAVIYVPADDPEAIRNAVSMLRESSEQRRIIAARAQARMGASGLSSLSYAQDHVALSLQLLHGPARDMHPQPALASSLA